METIYQEFQDNDSITKYTGGFIIGGVETSSLFNSELNGGSYQLNQGGGNKRFQNKVIPFGLAMKRTKPYIGHECKNGDVLDSSKFEQLFNLVAKVEKREKTKKNKTKRIK
jgi:hypothetical protein